MAAKRRIDTMEENRAKLIAAARKAFAEKGFAAASMDELTARRTALQSEYRKAQQKNGSTTPSTKTSVSYWNSQRMLYSRRKDRMNLNKRNN